MPLGQRVKVAIGLLVLLEDSQADALPKARKRTINLTSQNSTTLVGHLEILAYENKPGSSLEGEAYDISCSLLQAVVAGCTHCNSSSAGSFQESS